MQGKSKTMNQDNPITYIIVIVFIFILVFSFTNKYFEKLELPIAIIMGYDVYMDGAHVDNKSSIFDDMNEDTDYDVTIDNGSQKVTITTIKREEK